MLRREKSHTGSNLAFLGLENAHIFFLSSVLVLVLFIGHEFLNDLYNTPQDFLSTLLMNAVIASAPALAGFYLFCRKYNGGKKIQASIGFRIKCIMLLTLTVIMNYAALNVSSISELPYHTLWPVSHDYYTQVQFGLLTGYFVVVPVGFFNFHLLKRELKKVLIKKSAI
jgi:hypothetical protein